MDGNECKTKENIHNNKRKLKKLKMGVKQRKTSITIKES